MTYFTKRFEVSGQTTSVKIGEHAGGSGDERNAPERRPYQTICIALFITWVDFLTKNTSLVFSLVTFSMKSAL